MNPAVKQAISTIMQELQRFEAQGLSKPAGGMKVEIEAEGAGEPAACEACAAGTCDDPEHLSAEDSEDMAGMYT